MCLLILKPAGKRLPTPEEIAQAWTRNKDGGGFSFREGDGSLTLCKGIFCVDSMIASMATHLTPAMEAVIHLRYSTHKGDKVKNCHPHRIGDGTLGVCSHNGVIDIAHRKGESDTRAYVRQIIEPLMRDNGGLLSPAMARVIGRDIGRGNKLVITPASGESIIINEDSGHWHEGLWWSNTSAFPTPAVVPRTMGFADWQAPKPRTWEAYSSASDYTHSCKECGENTPSTEVRWRGGAPFCLDCSLKQWSK